MRQTDPSSPCARVSVGLASARPDHVETILTSGGSRRESAKHSAHTVRSCQCERVSSLRQHVCPDAKYRPVGGVRRRLQENAYCNNPLRAPSHTSTMTGRLPSRVWTWDNAAEFSVELPTFAHYLRGRGYDTCLSGKMHFVDPERHHGFEERLASDPVPADFYYTDMVEEQDSNTLWVNEDVMKTGRVARSVKMDFDELTVFRAHQKLYDLVRFKEERPFLLTVSFNHPHDPYYCLEEHWDRYEGIEIPLPRTASSQPSSATPSRTTFSRPTTATGTSASLRPSRHTAPITVPSAISTIRSASSSPCSKKLKLEDNMVVIFTSDHGGTCLANAACGGSARCSSLRPPYR